MTSVPILEEILDRQIREFSTLDKPIRCIVKK
jgi:hypothetical protein